MSDLTLYANPMSRARTARWMLEEVGTPYETVLLDFGEAMNTAEYARINPMAKVPALRHGDVIVTETAAICAYLADAFPKANLAPPPTSPLRGSYYRWLFFAAGPIDAAASAASLGWHPDGFRQEARLGYGSLKRVEHALLAMLDFDDGPWLMGPQFTAADVYVGGQITWLLSFDLLPSHPKLVEYAARLTARPAAQKAIAADDALIAEASAPGNSP